MYLDWSYQTTRLFKFSHFNAYLTGKLWALIVLFSFIAQALFAQQEQLIAQIDSVNATSFQEITANPTKLEPVFVDIADRADSIGYLKGKAQALSKLALLYNYLSEYDKSTEVHLGSIRLFESLGLQDLAGNEYAELGYRMRRRNLDNAVFYMRKGIELLESTENLRFLADAYNNYGVVKLEMEQVDSALYFTENSLNLKIKNKDSLGIAYSYSNLGNIQAVLENYPSVIDYNLKALELRKSLNDTSGMAIDLTNLGSAYFNIGNYPLALSNYQHSLKLALGINYLHLAEHNYNELSSLYEKMGQLDSALAYFKSFSELNLKRLNEASTNRVNELEVQFETEQKEKELIQKQLELNTEQQKVRQRNRALAGLLTFLVFGFIIVLGYMQQQKIKRENLTRENELKMQLADAEMKNKIHKERERISRDLHDNVGSQITNLITGIEISSLHNQQADQKKVSELLETLDVEARNTMTDLRETIWLLDKEEVPFSAFLEHLRSYLNRQKQFLGTMNPVIENELDFEMVLNPTQSLNLMRIIQEALNNARKYADASEFSVRFATLNSGMLVEIKDNGKGMNLEDSTNRGNGLGNMKERTSLIGAEFSLESIPHQGTKISVYFKIYPQ